MDQLIPVLIFAALAFGKWLFDRAQESGGGEPGEMPPPASRPQQRINRPRSSTGLPEGESEEEKMRRFMEALGLPPESAPPRPSASTPRRPEPVRRTPDRSKLPPSPPIVNDPARTRRWMGGPSAPRTPSTPPPFAAPPVQPATMAQPAAPVSESAPAMEVAAVSQGVNVGLEQPSKARQRAASEARAARGSRPANAGAVSGPASALREQLRTPAALRNAILLKEILGAPKGLQSAAASTNFLPL